MQQRAVAIKIMHASYARVGEQEAAQMRRVNSLESARRA